MYQTMMITFSNKYLQEIICDEGKLSPEERQLVDSILNREERYALNGISYVADQLGKFGWFIAGYTHIGLKYLGDSYVLLLQKRVREEEV